MSAPRPPTPRRPAQPNGPVFVIALWLATVPGCFMANYDDFLDAGLDATTLVDADGAGSSDEEASSGASDTGPDELDANSLLDAQMEQDGGMDASDANPSTMDATTDSSTDSRVNPSSDGGADATADASMDASDARTDAESGVDGATDGNAGDTSTLPDAGDAALPCPAAGCTQTCGTGQVCSYTCASGDYCRFDCLTASSCKVECKGSSHCEVLSATGDQAMVNCESSAMCGRVCVNNTRCTFMPCMGGDIGGFFSCAGDAGSRCNWFCPVP